MRALPLPSLLLSLAPTCHRLALASEPAFGAYSSALGWKPNRRARGCASGQYKWRALLRSSSCHRCLEPGANFAVRRPTSCRAGAIVFKLCGRCAQAGAVHARAAAAGLEIDAIGMDGRALFSRQFNVPLHGVARQGGFLLGTTGRPSSSAP